VPFKKDIKLKSARQKVRVEETMATISSRRRGRLRWRRSCGTMDKTDVARVNKGLEKIRAGRLDLTLLRTS